MDNLFHVSTAPHIRDSITTKNIMYDVILALIPATIFGIYQFGIDAFLVVSVAIITSLLSEYLYQRFMKLPITVYDGSAILTGLLLALCLSSSMPLWMVALGSVFAIIVVKQLFGGLGQNFMNPALAARCFLLISFAGKMNSFVNVDATSSATALALLRNGEDVNLFNMFMGNISGTIGETSTIALLIGALYLIYKKVISPKIPLAVFVSFSVIIFISGDFSLDYLLKQICGGGLIIGAFFMATDYVTSPITPNGKIIYGLIIGILAAVFRLYGNTPEGMSFAIIISNLLVPLIEKVTIPKIKGKGVNNNEKNIIKDIIIFAIITLAAGLSLALVNSLTKEPIAIQNEKIIQDSYRSVFKQGKVFANNKEIDEIVDKFPETIKNKNYNFGENGIVIDDILMVTDKTDNLIGHIIKVTTKDGYGGDITLVVGIDTKDTITGIEVLSIDETVGLGMNAKNENFKEQYYNKQINNFTITKTGKQKDQEIDALSGATITSTAFNNAVNSALAINQEIKEIAYE